MFKPLDSIFYLFIITLILMPFIDNSTNTNTNSSTIVIKIGKNHEKEINSTLDSLYTINTDDAYLKLEVKRGKVRIIESGCANKHCIRMGWLEPANSGSIICIPQKTIISFKKQKAKQEKKQIDAITG